MIPCKERLAESDIFFSDPLPSKIVLEHPVQAESEGIKLRPEKMEADRIYHCVFEDKIFLFYKDEQTLYFSIVLVSEMSAGNAKTDLRASNEVFIGKKPLMTYVTATLVQLANEPIVIIKARGKSITRAVDVAQIIVKRMDTL